MSGTVPRALRPVMAGLAALAAVAAGGGVPVQAGSFQDLSGYWAGRGSVTLASGTSEQLKCVVTYRVAGPRLTQSLRCASSSYSINALAELQVQGQQVVGTWEERTYAASGSVSGRLTDTGMTVSIEGAAFTAAMSITATACQQTIVIVPRGLDASTIEIGLAKC